jgi:hypothetical protein
VTKSLLPDRDELKGVSIHLRIGIAEMDLKLKKKDGFSKLDG